MEWCCQGGSDPFMASTKRNRDEEEFRNSRMADGEGHNLHPTRDFPPGPQGSPQTTQETIQ